MVTVVVLINLLIAMMSDTYQRIQAKSDTEWKFGLAKLIRNMSRTSGTPSPLNLLVKLIVYIIAIFKFRCMSYKDFFHEKIPVTKIGLCKFSGSPI